MQPPKLFALIRIKVFVFFCITISHNVIAQHERTSYSDWVKFLNNSKIFNVEAGITPANSIIPKEILKTLNEDASNQSSEKLPGYCIKNKDNHVKLTYLTGHKHDFSTIYGFELTKNNVKKDVCSISKHLNAKIKTADGISLESSKEKVIKLLGQPTKNENNTWVWTYFYHEHHPKPYKKIPRIDSITGIFMKGGWYAPKDTYYYGTIKLKFEKNRPSSFSVLHSSEVGELIQNFQ